MMTVEDVEKAQQAWGDGIVAIAAAHSSGLDYIATARNHIQSLYAYELGPVLFKPTLAAKEQFRPTFEGALSYFVASNGECPEDKGFTFGYVIDSAGALRINLHHSSMPASL